MRLRKYAVTAILAVSALGIAGGTANAEPAAPSPSAASMPVADGARIFAQYANDAVTLTGAKFAVVGDNLEVTHDNNVTKVPLGYQGNKVSATAAPDGKSVKLVAGNNVTPKAKDINGAQWFNYELNRAAPGALVGAIVGGIIGIFFFGIGVIPGALLGAAAGLLIAGGQPLVDAGFAYFQGR